MIPPWWRRLLCRVLGHAWLDSGNDLLSFPVCARCGKWDRYRAS